MLSGHEFSGAIETVTGSFATGVQLRRLPGGEARTIAPPHLESLVLNDWLPQRREHERRLQRTIDVVDAQVAVLDERGAVVAVNRAWRLTASVHGLNDVRYGVGRNYLALCRAAAADGCRDATLVAEGIAGVLEARWRSFFYKYDWNGPNERRVYALLASRMVEGDIPYTVVSHELLESRPM